MASSKRPALPRDTPIDTPAVGGEADLIEAPVVGLDASALGAQALSLARSFQSIETSYRAWEELHAALKEARTRWARERRRLQDQGELLLGALRAAAGLQGVPSPDALASPDSVARRLELLRLQFEAECTFAEQQLVMQIETLRRELVSLVQRRAAAQRPRLRLSLRVIGEQRVLHLDRLSEEEGVLALWALSRRVPSRYGFLLDDAVDDLQLGPAPLYADEGVSATHPDGPTFLSTLEARGSMWPVKGVLPMRLGAQWVCWRTRGVVLEAEVEEAGRFRSLLTRAEAEQLTGALLAHKLAGTIELELVRD